MSVLQEQAIKMISNMSDNNLRFLIEIIQRLMLENETKEKKQDNYEKMQAFNNLKILNEQIRNYIPDNFNPDKELEEALDKKYGSID